MVSYGPFSNWMWSEHDMSKAEGCGGKVIKKGKKRKKERKRTEMMQMIIMKKGKEYFSTL